MFYCNTCANLKLYSILTVAVTLLQMPLWSVRMNQKTRILPADKKKSENVANLKRCFVILSEVLNSCLMYSSVLLIRFKLQHVIS